MSLRLVLAFALAPQGADVVRELKQLQRTLGFPPTGNFEQHSGRTAAYYRCYYTGKLELPDSYDGLRLKQGSAAGCPVDERKYDLFFYPAEAVASGSSPVTRSLARAPLERVLVVVPHEDFHQSQHSGQMPRSLDEAASTLAGFVTAAEFARRRYGETSELYRKLAREPELFLRKSEIVNRFHARLRALYQWAALHKVPRQTILVEKVRLFVQAQRECDAIQPDPATFNKRLSAGNNAGLAFDFTYTRHYPEVYRLWEENGRDVGRTLDAIRAKYNRKR